MTVTHTEGYPVVPAHADALLIGMGERYDVQVNLGDGVFPWWRPPWARTPPPGRWSAPGQAPSTGCGYAPRTVRPPGPLSRPTPTASGALPARAPDVHRFVLTGGMARYERTP